ncbi:MAG TPA: S41 family peptidase, partial [Ferruginibacter sp.]|nr:S41 family peptidase [Ferruginibacter sp.]
RFDSTIRRENLSTEEKLEGLSRVWQEARFNFANFDLVPNVQWDSLYRAYVNPVIASKDIHEYYNVLKQFNQHLRDGHSRVMEPPAYFFDRFGGLPIRFRYLSNKVVVYENLSDHNSLKTITPGLVLEKIDDIPVQEYIKRSISPYLHFSTPQDSMSRIYTYQLLSGKPGSSIKLAFTDKNNNQKIVYGVRTRIDFSKRLLDFDELPGNIGHLTLHNFGSAEIVQQFDSLFARIQKTSALIIDVRYNGGGNSNYGHEILGYLTREPFLTNVSVMRSYHPSQRAWGGDPVKIDIQKDNWKPYRGKYYGKPVVLLIGPATYSAAEDFTGAFKANKFGMILGETTGGSTGQPLGYDLPGGGIGFICTKRDYMADGTEFVGTGIHPDVFVKPTLAGLQEGIDETLQAAINLLKRK